MKYKKRGRRKLKDADQQSVIDELKGQLQEMVRRMKIQKDGGDPNEIEVSVGVGNRIRKSFAASRLSRGISLHHTLPGETSSGNPLFNNIRKRLSVRQSPEPPPI
jgi:hypothetical protein